MIIVRLNGGGLGNQLFQYAAGRRLAIVHNTVLKLDLVAYSDNSYRTYGLDKFNIRANKASLLDIFRVCPSEAFRRQIIRYQPLLGSSLYPRLLARFGKNGYRLRVDEYDAAKPLEPLMIGRVVAQRFFHFDPEVLGVPDNVALVGNWISEKFFVDVRPRILNELSVKTPFDADNSDLATQIVSSQSISLHVRRGDKVNNPVFPATELGFINRAISFMSRKLPSPHFFVFSDDIDWCRQSIPPVGRMTFVDSNRDRPYEDLRLMTMCRHNIIAESTLSWWGAWLNPNPTKIVVSPPAHRTIALANFNTADVLPPEWIVL